MRRGLTLIEILILCSILTIMFLILCGLGLFGGLMPHYSDGQRTGVVVKLSHKGVILKSWEGELNVGSTSTDSNGSAVPRTWVFSATDAAIVEALREASVSGKRVTLKYHQYLAGPVGLDTSYVVDAVE
jgi:hypothetical protein